MPKNPSICYGCCPKWAPSMQARDRPWCWSWEHQNSLLARMSSTKRKSESALSKPKKINANGILAHVSSDWDILPEKYWTNVEISHIYIYIYIIYSAGKCLKPPSQKGQTQANWHELNCGDCGTLLLPRNTPDFTSSSPKFDRASSQWSRCISKI